jgi:hypothetical protein
MRYTFADDGDGGCGLLALKAWEVMLNPVSTAEVETARGPQMALLGRR